MQRAAKIIAIAALLQTPSATAESFDCARIVSLAPSVTETLYSLHLGDQIVGVSRYCNYPAAAHDKAKVGGLLDINYEQIVRLKPTLVILTEDDRTAPGKFKHLGLNNLVAKARSAADIIDTVGRIGTACNRELPAAALAGHLERELLAARTAAAGKKPKRVMIAVGRTRLETASRAVYISGRDGFYSDLLEQAGGINVLDTQTVQLPQLTVETLLTVKPEIIIEIVPRLKERGWSEQQVAATWQELNLLSSSAVRNLHIISADYSEIPGPRFPLLLKDFVKILNMERAR